MRTTVDMEARFWSKVERGPDCWVWSGGRSGKGYGGFYMGNWSGKKHGDRAHRVAYRFSIGPIPDGLQIDHLCRNRACVNPAHLEAVTQRVNILRGQETRTHCQRGHVYDERNTGQRHGTRYCRACNRERAWRYRVGMPSVSAP